MRKYSIVLLISVSFSFAQVSGLNGWNIFLDPGHSQTDNMGVNGYSEAEEVLQVGLALQDILLNQTDIDTVYISRTNNSQQVSLYQRTNHANTLGASWFHSIHSNAGASEHNNTLMLWGQLGNGNPDPPVGGEDMSEYMIDILTDVMRIPTVGSYGDCSFYTWSDYCASSGGPYLYVNRNTNMPSELSEEGYHTNPEQNQLYMNSEYARMLAYSFYWSILDYHEINRPSIGILSGIVTDFETGLPINGAWITVNGLSYTTDTFESLFHQYSTDPNELGNGFYFLEGLPNTNLEIIVSANHYDSDTNNISIDASFITFHDEELLSSLPPMIVETNPIQGDSLFPSTSDIIINFSRPMDVSSIDSFINFMPPINFDLQWSDNNKQLNLSSENLDFTTWYTFSILDSSLQDIYGHIFDGDSDSTAGGQYELYFRTGPQDMESPYIVSIFPNNVSQNIELLPIINLQFNELVGPDSLIEDLFVLERFVDHSNLDGIIEHYIVNSKSVFNFFPDEPLHPNETYVTRLYPGLVDAYDNEMNNALSFSFQTGSVDLSQTSIDHFESNFTTNWWSPEMSGSTTGIISDSTSMNINNNIVNHLTNSSMSMALSYGWNLTASSWLIREYLSGGAARNVQFTKSHKLQVYVFGDGSQNKFRFCVDDNLPTSSAGNHEVSPWFLIDWIGWKLISWDMINDGTGTWLGDGSLDGNLRIDSFQLTYGENGAQFGEIYFDDLRIADEVYVNIQDESGKEISATKFHLGNAYPNPFNPITTINYTLGQKGNATLKIFNLKGKLVRTLKTGWHMNGKHTAKWDGKDNAGLIVTSGTYISRVSTSDGYKSRKVTFLK
ncbi:MAG: T9SS type A sorting domain-containing protein [Candidatus Marinimicrobia bacterium]|jgi:hypothetical protein|nr:T9SS type A sorting domain-containing protein [Candidatus Neomarinimicrobiota bacterium]MBT6000973.1 T9SS type A sorting domain-containing protein [Candidatus Neomarinimicrobiota bacterium]MBT6159916.1 T9SS type A sorting domain-containing protein [Candidatus Neomarinimicrobiota bacterium]MBT7358693.1 T9SS type A sorting domain-containing protein [Candidatus Neomarinimicrobiota bacterium]